MRKNEKKTKMCRDKMCRERDTAAVRDMKALLSVNVLPIKIMTTIRRII